MWLQEQRTVADGEGEKAVIPTRQRFSFKPLFNQVSEGIEWIAIVCVMKKEVGIAPLGLEMNKQKNLLSGVVSMEMKGSESTCHRGRSGYKISMDHVGTCVHI